MPLVRPATREDAGALLALIDALADYESLPRPDLAARRRLIDHGFGTKPWFHSLLAEHEGEMAGYALYFFTYSSFLAQPTLYLEDIFVRPEHRGHGVGTALMRALVRQAFDEGCGRVEWQVLDWNRPAIDSYQRVGGEQLKEWLPFRLDRRAMEAFLASR
ncbi:MAG: GNAT family N-acetyltransferase [Chloroflexota bacterium]|nr:GNAT family N-acetyltransferase [Chloroflexota bacterium]